MARTVCVILGCCLLALLAGCPTPAGPGRPGAATQGQTPTEVPFAPWSGRIEKTFLVTLHAAGQRTTAAGILDAQNVRAFRLVAITEIGYVLFDASFKDGTTETRRILPGLPPTIVASICRDVALALSPPGPLEQVTTKGQERLAHFKTSEGYRGQAHFGATEREERLSSVEIEVGAFDKLTVEYAGYDAKGWPTRVTLRRPMRGYTLMMHFLGE